MNLSLKTLALIEIGAPLLGSMIAGLLGHRIGRRASSTATILLMIVSLVSACLIAGQVFIQQHTFYGSVYTWAVSGHITFNAGFLIDHLTALMMVIVTFVSLLVHIYSVGYMQNDPGYQRFFSYMSLFTFAMLVLVSANNFLQLFFGWEGVGLVSYLLIGFWFKKEAANEGALKAFLVNRVGDFAFILGLAVILVTVGSLDYHTVFLHSSLLRFAHYTLWAHHTYSAVSLLCVLLFIGAMGKSAQIPLHVWLPESMQGPTPISALIHAATMVTAGIFMVARLSPLYEMSPAALSMILVIGSTGALFLGLLAFVSNDIKRIIAYSTMSQLGYMMAANGASAFQAGIFHLATHACFKALLFLAAGSVMVVMKDEHDIRNMGGLRRYMPITYITFLIGALSLSAIPPFAGFYSKDAIIEAVHLSTIPGAHYAYICLLLGSFVTAFYIFREFFLVFHGKPRMAQAMREQLTEAPKNMLFAQIVLAIPAVALGALLIRSFLYQTPGLLGDSIRVLPQFNVLSMMRPDFHGAWQDALHAVVTLPFWFAVLGIFSAWFCVLGYPAIAAKIQVPLKLFAWILRKQYGFDALNDWIFVKGGIRLSQFFYNVVDSIIIDGWFVNGSGRDVMWLSKWLRRLQSGYIYHYVLVMIVGLVGLLLWVYFGNNV